jgi:hypothetical protein
VRRPDGGAVVMMDGVSTGFGMRAFVAFLAGL